jgi:hypothetical protein
VDVVLLVQAAGGVLWTVTYLLIIRQGFKDKSPGMPIIAMCANLTWEFIFAFIIPHGGMQGWIDIVWVSLDMVILGQYIRYGRKELDSPLLVKYFYPLLAACLVMCYSLIMAVSLEFNDPLGKYAAFGQNLMMSIMFVSMLIKRNSPRGQSLAIAGCKMIGSLIPGLGFYLYDPSGLMTLFSVYTLLFDLAYCFLLSEYLSRPKSVGIQIIAD